MNPDMLRDLAAKATPGPWRFYGTNDGDPDIPSNDKYFPGPNGLRSETTETFVVTADAVGAAGWGWLNIEQNDARLIALAPELAVWAADAAAYLDLAECEGFPICTLTTRCSRCALLARLERIGQ